MNKKKVKFDIMSYSSLMASILAIIVGLLVGFFVLLFCSPANAVKGFATMITAGIDQGGIKAIGNIFYFATPIMMTGLGVAVAFKAGVFNIGGSGQFIVGAFAAVYTAIKWQWLPGPAKWIVPIIIAALAGALWAFIPGILKAYRNVNIVISTIMMNYIGMYVVNYLVKATVYNSTSGQSQNIPSEATLPSAGLDVLFPRSSINAGIFIAIAICVLIWFLVNKTTFGYELKSCGMSPHASRYAGIKEKKNIVFSIMLSGALIGIGGALMYLSASGKHIRVLDVQASEGFTGIAVAILAGNSPLGVILSAIFIGFLTVGGQYIQSYGYVSEIVDIITAVVIYFAAFTLVIKNIFARRTRLRQAKDVALESSDSDKEDKE